MTHDPLPAGETRRASPRTAGPGAAASSPVGARRKGPVTMRRIIAFAGLLFGCATAAADGEPDRDHDVTVDDYFTQASVTDAVISPDGTQVVYVDHRWEPPRETRNPDLWLVPTAGGGPPRRLTFEFGAEGMPQWSPDGRHLFYLAARKRDDGRFPPYNDKNQVWRIAVGLPDGAPDETPVTRVESGVEKFQPSGDGRAIYYTVSKDANEDPWKAMQERYGKLTYGHGKRKVSELWKLDLSTWRAEKLVDGNQYIHEFSVTPDGRRVAMITADDDALISLEGFSRVTVHDTADGKTAVLKDDLWRAQAPSPYGWLTSPVWSEDGARLAFAVSFDGYPAELLVA